MSFRTRTPAFARLLTAFAIVAAALSAALPAGAAPALVAPSQTVTPPRVAVYLKNDLEEYDLATTDFLASQFVAPTSTAVNLITYTIVSTITSAALGNAVALVIDESADQSLTANEALLVHDFVNNHGGKVGLFTYPRFFFEQADAPNPAAYQGLADLFGNAVIGNPAPGEQVAEVSEATTGHLFFSHPYDVRSQTITLTYPMPFTPITSMGMLTALRSSATQLPVAGINRHGILMTNPIGSAVEAGNSSQSYAEFVTDAIVWLAQGGSFSTLYLPLVSKP